MLPVDCPYDQISLLQSIFRAEQDVSGLPERLRFNEIDSVFRLIAFALSRIELELHGKFGNAFTKQKRSFVHPKDVVWFRAVKGAGFTPRISISDDRCTRCRYPRAARFR